METMTSEEFRAQLKAKKKPSKWGNITTYVGNIRFDSKAEAARYVELKTLQRMGKISGLELQPEFELQAKFRSSDGKMVRAIKYIADFQYLEGGKVIVEDVKGKQTDVFKIKRKMFLEAYPHLELRLTK